MEKSSGLVVAVKNINFYMNKGFWDLFVYELPSSIKVTKHEVILKDSMPHCMIISFADEKSKSKFVADFGSKTFPGTAVSFVISEIIEDELRKPVNSYNECDYVKFKTDYTTVVSLKYERSLKEAGLVYKDTKVLEAQAKVISYIIKKVGSNLFKGESIMNVSLPVTIFDERTLLEV